VERVLRVARVVRVFKAWFYKVEKVLIYGGVKGDGSPLLLVKFFHAIFFNGYGVGDCPVFKS
jgi:hypothetical protein